MIELVAAVTAISFQILYEVGRFLVWDFPRWLWHCLWRDDGGDAWDDGGRVYAKDAVGELVRAGVPEDRAAAAVEGVMVRENMIEGLTGLGMSKAAAGRVATAALKK